MAWLQRKDNQHPMRRDDEAAVWSPLGELEVMRRQMDRIFEQMLTPNLGRALIGMPALDVGGALMPNVELYTTDKEVVVKVELPGLDPKEVEVEVTEEAIHLRGELKKENEIKEDNYFRTERQYGHFDRVISLPNRIRDSDAKATFKHGMLMIRAPLAEEIKRVQARKLKIEG